MPPLPLDSSGAYSEDEEASVDVPRVGGSRISVVIQKLEHKVEEPSEEQEALETNQKKRSSRLGRRTIKARMRSLKMGTLKTGRRSLK
jgi:hypothetical protein